MLKENRSNVLDYQKKDRIKVLKTIIQLLIILAIGILLLGVLFDFRKYEEPDRTEWASEHGFIALSYFGVDRLEGSQKIEKNKLEKQLKALYEQGYVTISQQDIINYYLNGKALPERALFLSFEDGRNDSSLFAHPILKKYNYKATFLSYANQMGSKDHKFLRTKDMLQMMRGGYWELGSNGYRQSYINIFDDEGEYIGEKDETELTDKSNISYYNHYLMDFLRDENMIPIEDRAMLEDRIIKEYGLMKDIYNAEFGFVPNVYMIMHSNALYNNMNKLVEDVNDHEIKELYKMHFNLEGNLFNSKKGDLYNLTRVQPAPYWFTNHLLMKIKKDTGQQIEFITGNHDESLKWRQLEGATEFQSDRIVLTSPPAKEGLLYLQNSEHYENVKLTTRLTGNVVGKQSIYLRYGYNGGSFLRISLDNNRLIITEKEWNQNEQELGTFELSDIDKKEEEIVLNKASVYTNTQIVSGTIAPENALPVHLKGNRELAISFLGNIVSITVDNEPLVSNMEISSKLEAGAVVLSAQYSEENVKDDIYDAVFNHLKLSTVDVKEDKEEIVLSYSDRGFRSYPGKVGQFLKDAMNWAIDAF